MKFCAICFDLSSITADLPCWLLLLQKLMLH